MRKYAIFGLLATSWRHNICAVTSTLVLFNLLIINYGVYYVYSTGRDMLKPLASKNEKLSLYGILDSSPFFRSMVASGKDGGFQMLQQETIGRLFIMPSSNSSAGNVGFLGLDVSGAGEASFIYKRILSRHQFPYSHLVVDIGANDGLTGSNSYNFIQWGWDAVLVEPLPAQIKMAWGNTKRFVDPYKDGRQQVNFEQAVISNTDGEVELVITRDLTNMENHLLKEDSEKPSLREGEYKIKVKSLSVKTLADKHHIPKYFGILSIDAEGVGDKVLHQWLELDFRPAYIIYESLHNKEPWGGTKSFLQSFGYAYLTKLGWNHIYELRRHH